MSRRCKPGIRARIIRGSNAGKIVVVVRRYFGEDVNNARWPKALFPWVVTSLGQPLRSFAIGTGKEAPLSMTIVMDDCDLEPITDDDGNVLDIQCGLHKAKGHGAALKTSMPKALD